MCVQYQMPNGEIVPVPMDVVAQGREAEQAFYDNQLARIAAEVVDAEPSPKE